MSRRRFLHGAAGTAAAVAVVRRPAWAAEGQKCYVKLLPCVSSEPVKYIDCDEVQGMLIGAVVKDTSDDRCYRISSEAPGSTSSPSVSSVTEDPECTCSSCRTVFESVWDCEAESWGPVEKIVDNECGPCEATDEWTPGECNEGKLSSRWVECGITCQNGDCSGATSVSPPTSGPSLPPDPALIESVCGRKVCRYVWESYWDCEADPPAWSTPEQVGSECDYCCGDDEWEYDRCDGSKVYYKRAVCDDQGKGDEESVCETEGDCSAGTAPEGKSGEPPEADNCCVPPCTNPVQTGGCCFSDTSQVVNFSFIQTEPSGFNRSQIGPSTLSNEDGLPSFRVPVQPWPDGTPYYFFIRLSTGSFAVKGYVETHHEDDRWTWYTPGEPTPVPEIPTFITGTANCCGADIVNDQTLTDPGLHIDYISFEVINNGCCRDSENECVQGSVGCDTGECDDDDGGGP